MIDRSVDYGVLNRSDFLAEFAYRFKPGQHVILFGPTGRGKTTLLGGMVSAVLAKLHEPDAYHPKPFKFEGAITIQLGPDPALAHLGKPANSWPPRMPIDLLRYDEDQIVRRYQPEARKPEHFIGIRRMARDILLWMFGRKDWLVVIPDLQVVADPGMMGLGKEVDQLLLTLRKKSSSVFMDAQAPRWIPRSSADQTAHVLIWQNRDELTLRRLAQIAGLPYKLIMLMMEELTEYACLWCDVRKGEFFVVEEK